MRPQELTHMEGIGHSRQLWQGGAFMDHLGYEAMSGKSDIGDKMDVWAQIWPNPDPCGKVHKSVMGRILRKIGLSTRFETIIVMVSVSGIEDDLDQIATARAIRDTRDQWRASYVPGRKAICA